MAIIGPGASPDMGAAPTPLLEGASEYEFVTLLNPLTDDFAVRVAQDVPVNLPFNIGKDATGKTTQLTNSERDMTQIYGLGLKNPDFQGRKHIFNDTIIPAGQTVNFRGNEAQVAVRQLVNEILQREGQRRLLADPVKRLEVEQRIIIRRGSLDELMSSPIQTVQQQATHALKQSNEVHNEPFPELSRPTEADADGSGHPAHANNPPNKRTASTTK